MRYMANSEGIGFLVWKEPWREPYCNGSWAVLVRRLPRENGSKVACPVCGRLVGISSKQGWVWSHHR